MGLISSASINSVWHGFDYYKEHRVTAFIKLSQTEFQAKVAGSANHHYDTFINIGHIRKSLCSCPHAAGKRIICKHMIALLFAAFPDEATAFQEQAEAFEKQEEEQLEQIEEDIIKYVRSLKKEQLQHELLSLLFEGPDWLWKRFYRDTIE